MSKYHDPRMNYRFRSDTKVEEVSCTEPSRRSIRILVGATLFALVTVSPAADATKINRFIILLNSNSEIDRVEARAYFNGVLDTVMYANGTLFKEAGGDKVFCLPEDIPGRGQLLHSFLEYKDQVRKEVGAERMKSVYVDQLLFTAFKNAYPCPR